MSDTTETRPATGGGESLQLALTKLYRHALNCPGAEYDEDGIEDARRVLSAALASSAGAAAGDWVTVPREPTAEMIAAVVGLQPGAIGYDTRAYMARYDYRAMIEAAPALPASPLSTAGEGEDLDTRMKAAGMFTVAEMMGDTPLSRFAVHPGVVDLVSFGQWLDRKVAEYLRMRAAYELKDKDKSDELYEWVLSHSAAFKTIRDHFRKASHPAPAEHGAEIRALSEKATPGPWGAVPFHPADGARGFWLVGNRASHNQERDIGSIPGARQTDEANAALIVALVNAYRAGELIHRSEALSPGSGADRGERGVEILERVRHVKRGTEYEVLGEAEAQITTQDYESVKVCGEGRRILREGQSLTVYRCLKTGKLWCRFTDEMRDGRFVPATPTQRVAEHDPARSGREG